MHKHAMVSAQYAECAARQDKFWPFVEKVFDTQDNWKGLNDASVAFNVIAQDLSLDKSKLESCLKDQSVQEYILKNKQEGEKLGVQSTPTYFINNKMIVGTKNLEMELNQFIGRK